jgi:lysophospholipase L1-like esterase
MRRLGNLALLGVALGVVFAVTEAALTFLVPPPIVWRYPQESYEPDGKRLHRLRPNQSAFTQSAPVSTNSYGLRNDEFSPRPAGGVVRILCIGDSLTFGNGVRLAETYPKQLEALLNGQHGRRYEVINAGVPAYDTWQEIAYLRDEGLRLAPDVVIVGFYGNDIVPRPKAVPVRSSTVPEEGTARRIMYWLKRSRVMTLLSTRIRGLENEIRPTPEVTRERALLAGTYDDFNEAGFREVGSSFAELAKLAREHGFRALVVLFPMPNQLLQDWPHSMYPSRVRDIAAQHDVPALDLMPAFKRELRGLGSLFIAWDGHPNSRAYAIAAQEIGAYMRAIASPVEPSRGTLREGQARVGRRFNRGASGARS